jgi:hypothetical protein
MKAVAENYKGIEFVQISSLPLNQKNEILKSLGERLIIKILKKDDLLKDCVQFQHYDYWYENIFKKDSAVEKIAETKLATINPLIANFQKILSTQ